MLWRSGDHAGSLSVMLPLSVSRVLAPVDGSML
jgi:hypothetical protein